MEPKSKQSSVAAAFAVEGLIVFVLVAAILTTLNYFGIVPLSSTFPFLSFLPSQSPVSSTLQTGSQGGPQPSGSQVAGQPPQSKTIVTAGSPLVVDNPASKFIFEPIKNSNINPRGALSIETELSVSNDASDATGIIFTKGYGYDDERRRSLSVFYHPERKNWLMEYRANKKSEYLGIEEEARTIKLNLIVGPLGKSVEAKVGTKSRTFQFSSSLFDSGKQMRLSAQVAPNSELTVSSLSYK